MMNCMQLAAALADFLDRRLSEAEVAEVKGHLAMCKQCTDVFRWEESVLSLVKEKLKDVEPLPAGIEDKLFSCIKE